MYQLTKKKTNPVLKFLGFLLALSLTSELLKVIFQRPSINEQLVSTVQAINKRCPMMVDSLTRLDNSAATSDNKLQFNYTLIKEDKADIDTVAVKNNMRTNLINKLKTDPKFQDFKQNDISISATFYDKSGNYVLNLYVDPKQF